MNAFVVDAFTNELFGGNPAGIVILYQPESFPPESTMVKVANEFRYSETAFVKPISPGHFHIRYFTPCNEVDLCGHATIGAFGAMLESGLVKDNDTYTIDTKAGTLRINIKNQLVFMDMSAPQELKEITQSEELKKLASIMGIKVDEIGMIPQIISTGLPDIMLHIKSKETLLALQPDFPALAKLSEEYGVVGLHAFTLSDQDEVTAFCRNFAPLYDINEEAATGTANGALTYYLYKNKIIDGSKMYKFLQGESMKRPSEIFSTLKKDAQREQIRVGGAFRVVTKGELLL